MLNRITIMGRLTRDPELRYTQNQIPVCSFSVAVERDIAKEDGTRDVDFIDVTAWRHTGEIVSQHFNKGRMIAVDGKLQSRKWTDRDGNNRTSWEIIAESVYFCGDKQQTAEDGQPAPAEPQQTPKYQTAAPQYQAQPTTTSQQPAQMSMQQPPQQSGYRKGWATGPLPEVTDFSELDEDNPFIQK